MRTCEVYWGSHGCSLRRGHEGPHLCVCHDWPDENDGSLPDPITREYADGTVNVGGPPYYGPDTRFFGADVPSE